MKHQSKPPQGFTLIELLIVVAIIAILAAIAVPNFLEAQLRAKVGRTKSDLRTISLAIESYAIDYNGRLPIINGYVGTPYGESTEHNIDRSGIFLAWGLTTPVSYMTTTAMPDPFNKAKVWDCFGQVYPQNTGQANGGPNFTYNYVNVPLCRWEMFGQHWAMDNRPRYFLLSYGPDYMRGPFPPELAMLDRGRYDTWLGDYAVMTAKVDPTLKFDVFAYDPTNGTVSGGDVIRHP